MFAMAKLARARVENSRGCGRPILAMLFFYRANRPRAKERRVKRVLEFVGIKLTVSTQRGINAVAVFLYLDSGMIHVHVYVGKRVINSSLNENTTSTKYANKETSIPDSFNSGVALFQQTAT